MVPCLRGTHFACSESEGESSGLFPGGQGIDGGLGQREASEGVGCGFAERTSVANGGKAEGCSVLLMTSKECTTIGVGAF